MSQRAKRPNNHRSDDGTVPPTKRRKCRPTATEEEEAAAMAAAAQAQQGVWQPRPLNDLKISSIYNRSATEAPAELFRKDLISAMKLPDSEPLAADEYWIINDQWKQEWERGVQVPVNPDSLPEPSVTVTQCAGILKPNNEFKLPKNKYIRITKDDNFSSEEHILSNTPAKAEAACSYDLDDCDVAWLQVVNGERAQAGLSTISEDQLERVIEQLELHCWDKIQTIMKNEEGLGIEYDENVICDVCRSPDSEEGNEMVFCDSCNICVHQACYGIMTIPAGQWLCCTCSLGHRPDCVLCPNKGGAMKCTRSGQKWAHVSCALWIPEVSIGCVEKMEPITKISSIPQSRWALICVLCRERVGACIQCSVKTCKTAYHVTCAFKHGLEMRAIIEDENADDGVKLRSYCQKHSVSSKKEKSVCSGSEDDDSKRKKRKDMTSEEKNQARAARLHEIEAEFDKHVSVKDIMQLEVDSEGLHYIYNYWKLKRRAGHNKPLLPPKSEDVDMLSHKQEQADLEKMKMFVQLRQDLERVRNLCYMVSRREKLSRSFFRMREQTFHKQAAVLSSAGHTMTTNAIAAVIEANHGPSIYDRLYSHSKAEDHTTDFEIVLARIAGVKSPEHESGDEKKADLNGIIKDRKLNNPYKRHYFNGSSKRRSTSIYGSSLSSASSSEVERKVDIHNNSSTENEKSTSATKKKATRVRKTSENVKAAERRRNRLNSLVSKIKSESSSEEDEKSDRKDWSTISKGRTLRKIEQEFGDKNMSGTDSDELMPVRLSKPVDVKTSAIYSDSDSSDTSTKNEDKSSNATSDSQQNKLKTKASVKEFSLLSKPQASTSSKGTTSKKKNDEDELKKDHVLQKSSKKKDSYDPTELIVPQRQAAKKASENLKSTTSRSKETVNSIASEPDNKVEKVIVDEKEKEKEKPKLKMKPKVSKEIKDIKEKEIKKDSLSKTTGNKTPDVFDIDKEFDKEDNQEILAYVPQRQAAKKAAEHIKSGLGKPVTSDQNENELNKNKKELDKDKDLKSKQKDVDTSRVNKKESEQEVKQIKKESEKVVESKRKPSTSSSSSSSSSSTSSTSSSSESEDDSPPPVKKPQSSTEKLSQSLFSSPTDNKRNSTKDWPFLDKAAKSVAIVPSSSSDSSDSPQQQPVKKSQSGKSKPENKVKTPMSRQSKLPQSTTKSDESSSKLAGKKFRKVVDKKLKTSEKQPEPEVKPAVIEREESSRQSSAITKPASKPRPRTKRQSNTSDRVRDVNVRSGDFSDGQCSSSLEQKTSDVATRLQSPKKEQQTKPVTENRKRKSDEMGRENITTVSEQSRNENVSRTKTEKESIKSSKLSSPIRKADKKLTDKSPDKISSSPSQPCNLEKEIMERKAGREQNVKKQSRSALDKLFEKRDKKLDKQSISFVPVKENKEPISFDEKFDNIINKSPAKHKHDDITLAKFNSTDLDHISEKAQKKRSTSPRYKKPEPLPIIVRKVTESQKSNEKITEPEKQKSVEPVTETFTKKSPIPDCETNIQDFSENNANIKTSEKVPQTNQLYTNRSIFSPQPTKDSTCPEMMYFVNAMLNVDESANDDGFGSSREDDNGRAPLSFTYASSELLFKEDSKEDSARETLNLVEKLRMELSKKSTTGMSQSDGAEEPLKEESNKIDTIVEEMNNQVSATNNQSVTNKDEIEEQTDVSVNVSEQREPSFPNSESNYHYSSCETDMQLEINKNLMPIQEQHLMDHSASTQADERWVPPSESFPMETNLQIDLNKFPAFLPPQKLHHQLNTLPKHDMILPEELHKDQASSIHELQLPAFLPPQKLHNQLNTLPKHDMILPEELHKDQASSIQDKLQSHTSFIEPTSIDCMPSPSPYAEMHQQAKWADSEVMPVRRSSSSSAASTSSSISQRNEDIELPKREEIIMPNHPGLLPDMSFGKLPQGMATYPPNSLAEQLPYHPYSEASQFVPPVSLFPPPNINTPIPFTSPGAALFPPSYGAPFPSLIPPIPKPSEDNLHFPSSCTAAFTSSSHNMALTAAMVSLPPPPTPKPSEPPLEEEELPQQESFPAVSEEPPSPASVPVSTSQVVNNASPSTDISSKSLSSVSAGKKSPSKPTRTSARFMSQQSKSPSKSPGKSPRQQDPSKSTTGRSKDSSKRGGKVVSRGTYSQTRARGRGRGRGRGSHLQHSDLEFLGTNTIHNKLVGTVYDLDFDDDIANDSVGDLRAMRERRRSTDIHDRKSESSYLSRDSSQSPKFTSPSHTSHSGKLSRASYTTDLTRDLRPPTPISDIQSISKNLQSPLSAIAPVEEHRTFPDIVQPVLPGPVDMRTYNSSFDPQPNNESYSNQILGEFAMVEPQLCDIDDEYEKNLEMQLRPEKRPENVESQTNDPSTIKVSLSDSRNQLKVKIKGPFLDSNYTSTVPSLPPQVNVSLDPIDGTSLSAATSANNAMSVSTTPSSGTSNLRRMRKKELLRQYWTQDMNMDEPANAVAAGQATAPTTTPQVSRAIITIPKAVASMTSIPTREDYKAVVDANMEKKRRKEKQSATGAYTRELRHLDLPIEDDGVPERRRSVGSTGSNASGVGGYDGTYKRKGRPPRTTSQQPTAPKLKIKIGNFMGDTAYSTIDDKKYKGRPPKKRLVPMPSVEDLKRESMKYRKMVMADFDEKKKKNKGEKSSKRKKRKNRGEVQIISNENANKLIIRFGKKKDDCGSSVKIGTEDVSGTSGASVECPVVDKELQSEQTIESRVSVPVTELTSGGETSTLIITSPSNNSTVSDLRKVRSIKLKFARCQEGSGYVMKSDTGQTNNDPPPSTAPTIDLNESAVHGNPASTPCAPLPLNKDCEVR